LLLLRGKKKKKERRRRKEKSYEANVRREGPLGTSTQKKTSVET
jgi:hypothetical protein